MFFTMKKVFELEVFLRKRPRHVSVWMSEAEYRHLKAQAQTAGIGVDPFIRNLVAGVQLRPRPPDSYAALLRELAAIGNNINQIARWANARENISQAEIKEAAELIRKAHRLIKETL